MKPSAAHRDRVMTALNHQEPDRVPLDLGSMCDTSVNQEFYRALKAHFGVQAKDVIIDRMTLTVKVDDRILEKLDVDTRGLFMGGADNGKDVELDAETYRDEWGVIRRRPTNSLYYDLVDAPLAGQITISDIVHHSWPDPHDPGRVQGLRESAETLRQETDFAIVLDAPSVCVHASQFVRGFEDWFIDMALSPSLMEALLDACTEIKMAMAGAALDAVGDLIDIVATGDDLGTQNAPMVSPETYRRLIKPRHRRYFDMVRSKTSAKIFFHTCGNVHPLLGDFIDLGIEILNPIQVSATEMEPARLKREFGDKLSFWGAIDTQNVLPYGTVESVKAEVERRIAELGPGGGYVVNPVHNVQPDVPVENLLAIFSHAREVGIYG